MTKREKQMIEANSETPAIVLVDPQMGENIGAAARAMLNCGLSDLRLVRPRDGWPNEKARAMSSGALDRMPGPKVFETTAEAIADCHFVAATTARNRDQVKKIYTARSSADELRDRIAKKEKTAILFGAERTGLENDDIALSHAVINIQLNPDFSSLNLGQAVLLLSYEWHMSVVKVPEEILRTGDSEPATQAEIENFLVRLERDLEASHFFRNPDMRPPMMRNIRNVYSRAGLTEQEVRTLHGILSAFQGKKEPPSR